MNLMKSDGVNASPAALLELDEEVEEDDEELLLPRRELIALILESLSAEKQN